MPQLIGDSSLWLLRIRNVKTWEVSGKKQLAEIIQMIELTFLERTVRISNRSGGDGKSHIRRRSSRPGLSRAGSSRSGLLLNE